MRRDSLCQQSLLGCILRRKNKVVLMRQKTGVFLMGFFINVLWKYLIFHMGQDCLERLGNFHTWRCLGLEWIRLAMSHKVRKNEVVMFELSCSNTRKLVCFVLCWNVIVYIKQAWGCNIPFYCWGRLYGECLGCLPNQGRLGNLKASSIKLLLWVGFFSTGLFEEDDKIKKLLKWGKTK